MLNDMIRHLQHGLAVSSGTEKKVSLVRSTSAFICFSTFSTAAMPFRPNVCPTSPDTLVDDAATGQSA